MEILVVALAALATVLIPLMVVMAEVALLGVTALVELGMFLWQWLSTGSLDAAREARQTRRESTATVRRWAWWAMAASSGVLAATLVAIVALNFLCFEWFVRRALRTAEKPSGIAVTFAQAEGNLFSGRIALRDAKFTRHGHPVSDFDLTAAKFDVDADVWQLLAGNFAFEVVSIAGVRGQFTRTGKRDPTLPRRRFTIGQLTVDDVAVEVTDASRPPHELAVPFEVTSLAIADFRSWWAAFDVLFRSTSQGLLDGEPVEITHRQVGEVEETVWSAQDMPIHVLSGYFAGPLGWLVDGRVDVDVTTRWLPPDDQPELEMHCHLVARGFAAEVPEGLAALERIVVEPAVAVLNRSQANLPIEFDLVMNKAAFMGQLSPLAAGLAAAISEASAQKLTQLFPNAVEKIGERVERIRNRLRARRQNEEPEPGDESD
jgi:hypothetical protein